MWDLLVSGSEELGTELGIEDFSPQALDVIDAWLAGDPEPLDEETTGMLGFLLARVLLETHGGGLGHIEAQGHPLDGEWTVAGFERDLGEDYQVPFLVSAFRIGAERALTARDWYEQLRREGARA